jgi:hypothetical protein
MRPEDVSQVAQGGVVDADQLRELRDRYWRTKESFLGTREGVDADDLAQSGWGVVFADGVDPSVRDAISELVEHRRAQASSAREARFRVFDGADAYRAGESKQAFLARHGVGPGPVDPDRMPYHLLLVGDPVAIPYRFQYQLDVEHSVGRLDLDEPAAYEAYARSVIAAERGGATRSRSAAFFAPANPGDVATSLTATTLVAPLADAVRADVADVATCREGDATKKGLREFVHARGGPALLFSATHGLGYASGDGAQRARQGALVCQEWEGPDSHTPVGVEQSFAACDVDDDAELVGLVWFMFACFGGGTPQYDDFADRTPGSRQQLAPEPFGSALPKRLLGHPRGGALAVIAHIDRAWSYSFHWPSVGPQTTVYESALARLAAGKTVGYAFEYFNDRYAAIASDLTDLLEEIKYGKVADHLEVAGAWTANNDARGFVVLGDPAVRLGVAP